MALRWGLLLARRPSRVAHVRTRRHPLTLCSCITTSIALPMKRRMNKGPGDASGPAHREQPTTTPRPVQHSHRRLSTPPSRKRHTTRPFVYLIEYVRVDLMLLCARTWMSIFPGACYKVRSTNRSLFAKPSKHCSARVLLGDHHATPMRNWKHRPSIDITKILLQQGPKRSNDP